MGTAGLLARQGDGDARAEAEQGLQLARASGRPFIAAALGVFAAIVAADDPDAARAAAEESVALQRSGVRFAAYGEVLALATLLRVRAGESAGALDAVREAVVVPRLAT